MYQVVSYRYDLYFVSIVRFIRLRTLGDIIHIGQLKCFQLITRTLITICNIVIFFSRIDQLNSQVLKRTASCPLTTPHLIEGCFASYLPQHASHS
jgi:hypothetical protein